MGSDDRTDEARSEGSSGAAPSSSETCVHLCKRACARGRVDEIFFEDGRTRDTEGDAVG